MPQEVIRKIVRLVLPFEYVEKKTKRLWLVKDAVKDLNSLALSARMFVDSARYLQCKDLLAKPPRYGSWGKLETLLNSGVPTTLSGRADSLFLDMGKDPDVRPVALGFFFRKAIVPSLARFQRQPDSFLTFLSTTTSNGKTIGQILYGQTKQLLLVGVPHPYYLFSVETSIVAQTFGNITYLEMVHSWSVMCFDDAVKFLRSFPNLERLFLFDLMVVSDDEKAAWRAVETGIQGARQFEHLKEISLVCSLSVYNVLAVLGMGWFPKLDRISLVFNAQDMVGVAERLRSGTGDLARLFLPARYLHMQVIGSDMEVWNRLDLSLCTSLRELTLGTGNSETDISTFLEHNVPHRQLERFTFHNLMSSPDLGRLDEVLSRLPMLSQVAYDVLMSKKDKDDVLREWASVVAMHMPLCAQKGILRAKKKLMDKDPDEDEDEDEDEE
ncbi:hypothetical protein VNI00_018159 [Paramarasmius palmivorus]|uniref:F-box domain-containing protein n=1 Tax=Paramarasmius palmivorus TaxID=297713 RepID=A0AAW0AZY8_9AGAR